jgi:hypothetical protein
MGWTAMLHTFCYVNGRPIAAAYGIKALLNSISAFQSAIKRHRCNCGIVSQQGCIRDLHQPTSWRRKLLCCV